MRVSIKLLAVGQHTNNAPATTPPLADSGLRCPVCEYNLTGVAENRCPECGNPFDPEKLRAVLAGAPAPILIWDDKSRNIFWRYALMCSITWFAPWRLPRMIPRFYRKRSGAKFRWMTMAFAILPVLVLMLPEIVAHSGRVLRDTWVILGVTLGVWASVATCEGLLASVLASAMTPDDVDRLWPDPRADHCWSGVVGFLRTFTILSVAVGCLPIGLRFMPMSFLAYNGIIAVYVVVFWWWAALSAAIIRQPAPWTRRIGCIVFIPFVAAFSPFIGLVMAVILVGQFVRALTKTGARLLNAPARLGRGV